MRVIRGAFPRQAFGPESEAAYALGLADLNVEVLAEVVGEMVKTWRVLPTVAEIREQVLDRQAERQPCLDDSGPSHDEIMAAYEAMNPEERATARFRLRRMGVLPPRGLLVSSAKQTHDSEQGGGHGQ